jgi:hypothetical protein
MCILAMMYRTRQQYTDWYQTFGTQKCLYVTSARRETNQLKLWSHRLKAVHQLQQRNTAARIHIAIDITHL